MFNRCHNCCEFILNSECIKYTGKELPCTGIVKGDWLEQILKKIDDKICSIDGLVIEEGSNITITGTGTSEDPIIISSTTFENPLSFLTGLTRTGNNVRANISTGISGGQVAWGGIAASENLTLSSTTSSTKGKIILGISATDEVRLGAYTSSRNDGSTSKALYVDVSGNLKYGTILGGGGGTYTVDNGLTENPSGNFQLGGPLTGSTEIEIGSNIFSFTDGADDIFKIDNVANTISWMDGSLATASAGFVWTLSNTATGEGEWATPAAGGSATIFQATFSGDGSTSFTIAHGLVGTPKAIVMAASEDAANISYITVDNTNITVEYQLSPPVGVNNIKINWTANL